MAPWAYAFAALVLATPVVRAEWPPPAPPGPFSAGEGNSTAIDAPVPGFVGPLGNGTSPFDSSGDAIDDGQYVNPAFVDWASNVTDYSPANPGNITLDYTDADKALGPVTGNIFDVVSLGEMSLADINAYAADPTNATVQPGEITLTFDHGIGDGPGPDFVVFENAIELSGSSQVFAELAYVAVSTDGVWWAWFPCVDRNPSPVGQYGSQDVTRIHGLAGKHVNGNGQSWGTPFDLSDLAWHPYVLAGLVDLNNIQYVRIIDIPGSGAFGDDYGNRIYDPWPTEGSPGFDLEAIGVLNSAGSAPTETRPGIATDPVDTSATEGQTATFTVTTNGYPAPAVQWQRLVVGASDWVDVADDTNFSGNGTLKLTVSNVTLAMAGDQYRCQAWNYSGNATSASAALAVNAKPPPPPPPPPKPPVVKTQPVGVSAKKGKTVSFKVVASGTGPLSYAWQRNSAGLKNSGSVAGATTAKLTLKKITKKNAGTYRVIVANPGGRVTSKTAKLTVK